MDSPATPSTLSELINIVLDIINVIIPALFGFVFIFLAWKLIDAWIIRAGDPAAHEAGKQYAFWAVVMAILMVSTWGIVYLIRSTFFL